MKKERNIDKMWGLLEELDHWFFRAGMKKGWRLSYVAEDRALLHAWDNHPSSFCLLIVGPAVAKAQERDKARPAGSYIPHNFFPSYYCDSYRTENAKKNLSLYCLFDRVANNSNFEGIDDIKKVL